jgi:hypothetical protein
MPVGERYALGARKVAEVRGFDMQDVHRVRMDSNLVSVAANRASAATLRKWIATRQKRPAYVLQLRRVKHASFGAGF